MKHKWVGLTTFTLGRGCLNDNYEVLSNNDGKIFELLPLDIDWVVDFELGITGVVVRSVVVKTRVVVEVALKLIL